MSLEWLWKPFLAITGLFGAWNTGSPSHFAEPPKNRHGSN
jgi:hypothetical protein